MYRIAIFIDGGYLDRVLRDEFGETKVDNKALTHKIAAKVHKEATVFRAYYYHSMPFQSNPPARQESKRFAASEKFHNALNRLPRFHWLW